MGFLTLAGMDSVVKGRRPAVKWLGKLAAGPGFESRVRHKCGAVRPSPHQWLRSKTGRREGPGSLLGRVNTG